MIKGGSAQMICAQCDVCHLGAFGVIDICLVTYIQSLVSQLGVMMLPLSTRQVAMAAVSAISVSGLCMSAGVVAVSMYPNTR